MPATLDNELASVTDELARQDKVLAQRRSEITAINAKYESDKQRWRELRTDPKRRGRGAERASNASRPLPGRTSTGQGRGATASSMSNVAPK